ncbi:hypothetical protein MGN70_000499 [Eutypa lata]|nr:hypothetical protein MGN70_000499 [Eutypa lata]
MSQRIEQSHRSVRVRLRVAEAEQPIRDDDVVDTPYPEVNQELDLPYSEVNIANIESTIAFTQIVGFESEAVEETANEVKGG